MKQEQEVDGLISLGYESEDWSGPQPVGGGDRPKVTRYPTLRVCKEAAAELHKALSQGKLLDGEFAAIVVLKSTMIRVADDDDDEDESEDVELEFSVRGIMPDLDSKNPKLEEEIMADFEKLPRGVKEAASDEEVDGDDSGDQD